MVWCIVDRLNFEKVSAVRFVDFVVLKSAARRTQLLKCKLEAHDHGREVEIYCKFRYEIGKSSILK